ncbi:hypothetical protein HQ520_18340 [bacterium]|nr:hypothetical protein [bacterium]
MKTRARALLGLVMWGLLLLLSIPLAGAAQSAETVSAHFILTAPAPGVPDLDYWANLCEQALARLSRQFPESFDTDRKIRVFVSPDMADFRSRSGLQVESVMAVAYPGRDYIILNTETMANASAFEQYQTLGHELVHLLLGRLDQERVPQWLHEGLAQIIPQQSHPTRTLALAWAQILNRCIPMRRLNYRFPYDTSQADLAYAQSASFTQYVATKVYSFPTTQDFFDALLTRPNDMDAILRDLDNPKKLDHFEAEWMRRSDKILNWILAITSTSLIWGLTVLFFVFAYLHKRHKEKDVMEDWDPWERN